MKVCSVCVCATKAFHHSASDSERVLFSSVLTLEFTKRFQKILPQIWQYCVVPFVHNQFYCLSMLSGAWEQGYLWSETLSFELDAFGSVWFFIPPSCYQW